MGKSNVRRGSKDIWYGINLVKKDIPSTYDQSPDQIACHRVWPRLGDILPSLRTKVGGSKTIVGCKHMDITMALDKVFWHIFGVNWHP